MRKVPPMKLGEILTVQEALKVLWNLPGAEAVNKDVLEFESRACDDNFRYVQIRSALNATVYVSVRDVLVSIVFMVIALWLDRGFESTFAPLTAVVLAAFLFFKIHIVAKVWSLNSMLNHVYASYMMSKKYDHLAPFSTFARKSAFALYKYDLYLQSSIGDRQK